MIGLRPGDLLLAIGKAGNETAESGGDAEHLLQVFGPAGAAKCSEHRLLHGQVIEFAEIILQFFEVSDQQLDLIERKERTEEFQKIAQFFGLDPQGVQDGIRALRDALAALADDPFESLFHVLIQNYTLLL